MKNLLSLYRPFQGSLGRQEGLKIYAGILAFIAAMTVLVWFREYQFGDEARAAGFLTHLGIVDVKVFLSAWVMALFLNQGGLLEELGWRGYALPLLTRRLQSPLVAVLLVGVAWALWHFPREIAPLLSGQQSLSGLVSGQALSILSCCSMSVVASYFVNITGGSVLPAIMVHGTFNMVGGMFSTGTVGVRSELGMEAPIMWLVAALAVLLFAGPDLGWKRRLLLRDEAS
ncbi:MAG: CPBP family intramembrane metalloprotease [Kordiimonadaceae bacterium]|nr:CPBP family intramembrane metalloprotease [Kordiimonadaceae bacterium]